MRYSYSVMQIQYATLEETLNVWGKAGWRAIHMDLDPYSNCWTLVLERLMDE